MLQAMVDDIPPVRTPSGRRRTRPGKIDADKGYDSAANRAWLRRRGITARIARRGIESSTRLGRHRWRVERALSWLSCYRRLAVRWDRGSELWFAFVLLACALVGCNRLRHRPRRAACLLYKPRRRAVARKRHNHTVNDVLDVDRLVDELAAHDGETRSLATEALVGLGAAAVPAVVAALVDETSPVNRAEAGLVLRRIGPLAFNAVRDAIAAAPTREARRRAGWVFVGFGAAALAGYIAATRHPHPQVRADAATGIGYLKARGLPGAAALVELLADPDQYVRERAVGALPQLGMAVLPVLQQVRRGGPSTARHGALVALANLAGERGLSQRDQAAITRLIRVKLSHDLPEPFLEGSWLAVPGADQVGIIALLGLAAARPATFALGLSAVANDAHGWQDPPPPDRGRRVVFITPELAGWTLVIGGVFPPVDRAGEAECLRTCRQLAGRYGMGQAFSYDELSGWSAWTVADDHPALFVLPREPPGLGRILRHHVDDNAGGGADIGEPLPVEVGCADRLTGGHGAQGRCSAIEVAEALSVNPQQLGPQVPMRGHGLLAFTSHGVADGLRAGALRI